MTGFDKHKLYSSLASTFQPTFGISLWINLIATCVGISATCQSGYFIICNHFHSNEHFNFSHVKSFLLPASNDILHRLMLGYFPFPVPNRMQDDAYFHPNCHDLYSETIGNSLALVFLVTKGCICLFFMVQKKKGRRIVPSTVAANLLIVLFIAEFVGLIMAATFMLASTLLIDQRCQEYINLASQDSQIRSELRSYCRNLWRFWDKISFVLLCLLNSVLSLVLAGGAYSKSLKYLSNLNLMASTLPSTTTNVNEDDGEDETNEGENPENINKTGSGEKIHDDSARGSVLSASSTSVFSQQSHHGV